MKRVRWAGLAAAVLLVAWGTDSRAATWMIDESHSGVGFAVKHMMITNVKGQFTKLSGKVVGDLARPTRARVEVEIDATSIDTRNAKRDAHLRSADFFNTAKHPQITFRSKRIKKARGKLQVHGQLTMNGQTRPLKLTVAELSKPIKGPFGKTRVGLSASGTIDRRKWGLKWNKAMDKGGLVVGNKVAIFLDVQLIKK